MSYEAKDMRLFAADKRMIDVDYSEVELRFLTQMEDVEYPEPTTAMKFADELNRCGELTLEVTMDFQRIERYCMQLVHGDKVDAVLACQHAYGSQVVYDALLGDRYAN